MATDAELQAQEDALLNAALEYSRQVKRVNDPKDAGASVWDDLQQARLNLYAAAKAFAHDCE